MQKAETVDLFGYTRPTLRRNGRLIDRRQVDLIDPLRRYRVQEAAELLGCSDSLVYELASRPQRALNGKKQVDVRHWQDVKEEKKYLQSEIARLLNCADNTVYYLRLSGGLQQVLVRRTYRVPGWSLADFIKENASPIGGGKNLDFLTVRTILLIPGWSLIDYISANCSEV